MIWLETCFMLVYHFTLFSVFDLTVNVQDENIWLKKNRNGMGRDVIHVVRGRWIILSRTRSACGLDSTVDEFSSEEKNGWVEQKSCDSCCEVQMNFSWTWLSSYDLDLTVHEFLGDEKMSGLNCFFGNDKITDGLDSSRTSRTDMIHADRQTSKHVFSYRDPGGSIGHL